MQGTSSIDDRPRVAVLIPQAMRARIFPDVVEDALMAFAEPVMVCDEVLDSDELDAILHDVPAVITGWKSPQIPKHSLAPQGSVEFVAHAAGSVKRLGVMDSLESGHIRVSHAAPVMAPAVAEFTLTQILAHVRHHREMDSGIRSGAPWFEVRDKNLGLLLGAQTVGIVGLGYVGRVVLNLLRPFGCTTCVYDPFVSAVESEELGVRPLALEELFRRCTIVSLHAANLPATNGMITRQLLESLSPGSLLVNTARAGLIERGALHDVLQTGQIHAAIDTFDTEPLPHDDDLRQLPNIYLSPHCAGHTSDSYVMQGLSAVEEVRRYFSKITLECEIARDKAAILA